ncbi:MAG: hypothetical protein HKP55_11020 [Gammaproteobacteria bacterium]|nr:hypothetical protein [Gammaproteobacteria bacterium]
MLFNLTLLDALIILFVLFKTFKPPSVSLGDSLHGLISIVLIIALILGLKLNTEMRGLVAGVADMMSIIPGLGSKLLVIIAAWYVMRLIRKKLGYWIEGIIPKTKHKAITRISEVIRSVLLVALLLWVFEGFFETSADTPVAVNGVRALDYWVSSRL